MSNLKHVINMKNIKNNNKKRILTNLKTVKTKADRMEFLRVYKMNKKNEFVKRSFGGHHKPTGLSNRLAAKMKHHSK